MPVTQDYGIFSRGSIGDLYGPMDKTLICHWYWVGGGTCRGSFSSHQGSSIYYRWIMNQIWWEFWSGKTGSNPNLFLLPGYLSNCRVGATNCDKLRTLLVRGMSIHLSTTASINRPKTMQSIGSRKDVRKTVGRWSTCPIELGKICLASFRPLSMNKYK